MKKVIFSIMFAMVLGIVVGSCTKKATVEGTEVDSTLVDSTVVDSLVVDSLVADTLG